MSGRIETVDVVMPPERAADEEARKKAAGRKLGVRPERIGGMRLIKESIDARKAASQ